MTTLNATEEIDLAKELIEYINGLEWLNFASQEKSWLPLELLELYKKKNIAFCGYHGWHDWYLAANLQKSTNLDKQLLPGLKTYGVSSSYKGSIKLFYYNDIKSLEKIFF